MKILVTGATDYIGAAAAQALRRAGHEVLGLARSDAAAGRLARDGFGVARGDFSKPGDLAQAALDVDAIVSTASLGSLAGDADTFAQDREAVLALLGALEGTGKTLVFTSGSAVFGVFSGGERDDRIFDEDTVLPLAPEVFAPADAQVPPVLVAGFGAAMAARVETEMAVAGASGVRGIVMRPGLVYGAGGSYDIPALVAMARGLGAGPHLGPGAARQSYVHLDDLADLYVRAIAAAPAGAALHGVVDEISLRDLASAVGALIGAAPATKSLTLEQMYQEGGSAGVSLSLNKRLSSAKTRALLNWAPRRTDILLDVALGSYAQHPARVAAALEGV